MTATLTALPDMADAPASPAPVASEHAEMWALIQRAQAGDAEAFGEIWRQYHPVVMSYLWYRTNDRPLCEDLCSEVFLRALRRIGGYTWQGKDIGAWFTTISRNLLADYRRSSYHRLVATTDDAIGADQPDDSHGPEELAIASITSETLREAMACLVPAHRTVLELRFIQGLTVAETAEALGMSESAQKSLQFRAIRALGQYLPDGFDPNGRKPLPTEWAARKSRKNAKEASCEH